MPISTVIENNLVSEKKVVLIISPVIYFFDHISDSFASPSKTVLWVFQHNFTKNISLNHSNFGH